MDAGRLHRLARELRAIALAATSDPGETAATPSELAVVEDIAEHGPTAIGAIARRTGIAQSLVSRTVAAMSEAGVLTAGADPDDLRRTRVEIDPGARDGLLRERAQRPIGPVLALRHAAVAPAELDRIEATLDELHSLMHARREPPTRDYVTVGGERVWHEVGGDGPPVVLLHGGFAGAGSWAAQVPDLVAAGYRVFVPERRGHGHTPDRPGPLTYASMADDTIAYLETVVGEPAHLVGWSDGAVVALLAAQRRQDLVDRMVLIGQYFNSDGRPAGGIVDQLVAAGPEAMAFLRLGYDPVTPDGADHFGVVFEKTMTMLANEPEIDLETLRGIDRPALLVQGDRDDVLLAHTEAAVRALPQGRLAVLPGSHLLPLENPALVNALLTSFLGG